MELNSIGVATKANSPGDEMLLANVLPQIIWICNEQGGLEWVNSRWFELTGLTEHETLHDKGALAAIHPDDREELTRRWTQALETSTATEIEYRIRDAAGDYRWHFARVTPVRGADGAITQWVAGVFDIHDRRTAEDVRRVSLRGPDFFFYVNPVPMAITRPSDGTLLYVNDAFTALTGYSREESIGRTSVEIGMVTDDERLTAASHFGNGEGRSFEVSVRMKDGTMREILLTNSHITVDGAACFLNTGVDLSHRRTMENTLREREARARAGEDAARLENQQKDEFLALISHELRNPLTPILTSARLLQERTDADAEVRRELEVIVQQVKHVSRLVDDLLDIARVTRGAITLEKTRVEPATALHRAIAATSPLFEQRGHTLEIDVPARGLTVDADEMRLTQIFDNLLSNAALYTTPGGVVRVSGERDDSGITLRVRDNGRGIDPSLLAGLFDSFVQGPRGPDRAEGGLGIGLALVRALTEMHGGTVSVHSAGPGRGSEFAVRLPAAPLDAADAVAMSNAPVEGKSHGARLLVVDDHPEVAGGLERLLRVLGYDVRTALDPHAAIDVAEAFRPQVALLDIGLPVMDGYRLASEMRARLGDASPVLIALSGYNQPQDIERSHAAGFATHLVKPVDVDDLVSALDAVVPQSGQA